MSEPQPRIVYVTCGSHGEAVSIAQTLLEERRIACANVFSPVTSLYRWNGILEETQEVVMVLKVSLSDEALSLLIDRVKELHPYECPAILALPVVAGDEGFLRWLQGASGGVERA